MPKYYVSVVPDSRLKTVETYNVTVTADDDERACQEALKEVCDKHPELRQFDGHLVGVVASPTACLDFDE